MEVYYTEARSSLSPSRKRHTFNKHGFDEGPDGGEIPVGTDGAENENALRVRDDVDNEVVAALAGADVDDQSGFVVFEVAYEDLAGAALIGTAFRSDAANLLLYFRKR